MCASGMARSPFPPLRAACGVVDGIQATVHGSWPGPDGISVRRSGYCGSGIKTSFAQRCSPSLAHAKAPQPAAVGQGEFGVKGWDQRRDTHLRLAQARRDSCCNSAPEGVFGRRRCTTQWSEVRMAITATRSRGGRLRLSVRVVGTTAKPIKETAGLWSVFKSAARQLALRDHNC